MLTKEDKLWIAQQFAEQNDRIDAKFEEQDKRIDAKFAEQDKRIDAKFAEQDKRLDTMDHRLDAMENRIGTFETNVNNRLDTMENRIGTFETNVNNRLNAMENRIGTFETNVNKRLAGFEDHLERQDHLLDAKIENIKETVEDLKNRIDQVSVDMGMIYTREMQAFEDKMMDLFHTETNKLTLMNAANERRWEKKYGKAFDSLAEYIPVMIKQIDEHERRLNEHDQILSQRKGFVCEPTFTYKSNKNND